MLCAAVVALSPPTQADDDTAGCIAAHLEAQRLQRDRQVRAARDALVRCSRQVCPPLVLEECSTMLLDIERAIPTVVFEARDAGGLDIADARVSIGQLTLSERLDGRAVEVDPGEHVFRFDRPGTQPVETRVVVREGDKGRRVGVVFPQQNEAPAEQALERDLNPLFWVAGGVGVVGVGLFGALGIAGLTNRSDLDDLGCKPDCPPEDVDEARSFFIAADISLAVGVAALVAAPIIYFSSPMSAPKPKPDAAWVGVDWARRGGGVHVGAAW
jgi:hypothetical protein